MRDTVSQRKGQLPRRSRWPRGRMLIGAASLVCCVLLVVANGAERADSGWAVAPPPSISFTFKPDESKRQTVLDHVLQQSQTPLLESRSNDSAVPAQGPQRTNLTGQGGLRFAVRPDGIEGWRPAGPTVMSLNSSVGPQMVAPPGNSSESGGALEQPAVADTVTDEELEWSPPSAADKSNESINDDDATTDKDSDEGVVEEQQSPSTEPSFGEMLKQATPSAKEPENTESSQRKATSSEPGEDYEEQSEASGDDKAALHEPAKLGPFDEDGTMREMVTEPSPPPLTKQLTNLRSRVRSVLKGYYRKQLNSRDNDPWEVMHGMLAYGVHSRVRQGGSRGVPVTSVGWLCYNKPCKNLSLLYVNPKGELRAKYGVGLQGHLGQFLAMLAQCRVSDEYPIRVGKREFTIKDLIEAEKKTCYPKSELTFKLLAFQYYLDLNDTWVNDQGVDWDFPRLIREELAQPIRGAACGGTHRLSSLSLTVKARQRRGEPLDGEYLQAHEFVQKYHRYAFSLQNRDGSLSTSWFRGRGDDRDIDRRIKTTGHILEWLCYSLSDEELRQPRTIAAVTYLANLMYSNYDHEWEVGPVSHATHALLLYDERVFQPFDGESYETTYKPRPRSATSSKRVRVQSKR